MKNSKIYILFEYLECEMDWDIRVFETPGERDAFFEGLYESYGPENYKIVELSEDDFEGIRELMFRHFKVDPTDQPHGEIRNTAVLLGKLADRLRTDPEDKRTLCQLSNVAVQLLRELGDSGVKMDFDPDALTV